MITNWINKKVISDAESMKKKFIEGKPFAHLQIKNFLNADKLEKLSKAIKKESFEEKDSDLFSFKQTQDLHYSRDKTIKNFVEMLETDEFSNLMVKITGMKLKSGALDLFGSLYEDTDYLLCHDDQLEDRKVAYILYLGEDFKESDGGSLALLDDDKGKPGKISKKYYPEFNSLAFFEVSKKSWHLVEEVRSKKKRYAIGGWLH